MIAFEDLLTAKRGRNGEQLVAAELQRLGWYVIPTYDYSGKGDDKAPKMYGMRPGGCTDNIVVPDLDASANGTRLWVEVKAKGRPNPRHNANHILEHGVDMHHWDDYKRVQSITGCQVWIAVYEDHRDQDPVAVCTKCNKAFPLDPMGETNAWGWVMAQSINALERMGSRTGEPFWQRRCIRQIINFPRKNFIPWFHVDP